MTPEPARKVLAPRLTEAREYLGFTREDVAGALRCDPLLIGQYEDGSANLTGEHLRKLSRLYGRPLAWLQGESTFQPSPDLLRRLEGQSDHDREAVLDFAEFLENAGPAAKITRAHLEANPDG